ADPVVRKDAGLAYQHVGYILGLLGQHEEAVKAYRDAIGLLEHLPADTGDTPGHRLDLANTYNDLAGRLHSTGRFAAAEESNRPAWALHGARARAFPTDEPPRYQLANCCDTLGILLRDAGRLDESEHAFRKALAIRSRLMADSPPSARYRHYLATSHH